MFGLELVSEALGKYDFNKVTKEFLEEIEEKKTFEIDSNNTKYRCVYNDRNLIYN